MIIKLNSCQILLILICSSFSYSTSKDQGLLKVTPKGSWDEIKRIFLGQDPKSFPILKKLTQRLEEDVNPSDRPETILLLEIVNYIVDDQVDFEIMHHLYRFMTRILSKTHTKYKEENISTALHRLEKGFLNYYGAYGRWK